MSKFNSAKLANQHQRSLLEVQHKPHWLHSLATGATLGLRHYPKGVHAWYVRTIKDGKQATSPLGKNITAAMLKHDADANGETVLSFSQACKRADEQLLGGSTVVVALLTVDEALKRYETKLEREGATPRYAQCLRRKLKRAIPALLSKQVMMLTTRELQDLAELFLKPKDGSKPLSNATYDRSVIRPLRAALYYNAPDRSSVWQPGLKELGGTSKAHNIVLTDAQLDTFRAAAWAHDHALGLLVEALADTGNRMSQVVRLLVKDFRDDPTDPYVNMYMSRKGGKTGVERNERGTKQFRLEISKHLAALFRAACKGRKPGDYILLQSNGQPWAELPDATVACRMVRHIVEVAGITHEKGNVTAYSLRHTSIVRQLKGYVPIRTVAANHNTSVGMIEKHYADDIKQHGCPLTRAALREPPPIGHNGGPALDKAA